MVVRTSVQHNAYRDSVFLMALSQRLGTLPGVRKAHALMATPTNLRLLADDGLATDALAGAGPNDLVVAVEAETDEAAERAVAEASRAERAPRGSSRASYPSAAAALEALRGADLAVVSIPGPYVRREAMPLLDAGLDLLVFSDNVPLEDEVALKRRAHERGLIVMGPGAGTAIIGGTALAFANRVRRGCVGIVAAAGTGIQEVSVQLHRRGQGVSHAIGTGGRDLSREVGGVSMLDGIEALAADPSTRVLVLVAKPGDPEVQRRVLERARAVREAGRPVVVHFIGGDRAAAERAGLVAAATLEDAAEAAAALCRGEAPRPSAFSAPRGDVLAQARRAWEALGRGRRYVRGLYSGGTLCGEAVLVLSPLLGMVRSNAAKDPSLRLADARRSEGHACVDLGEEEFTQGRPHPMIDHTLRCQRLLQEARDEEAAVVLLDVVLGHGASHDPAGSLAPAVREARSIAEGRGGALAVVASVCGTELDPQGLERQERLLREAGAVVMPSNAQAARMAALVATRGKAASKLFG